EVSPAVESSSSGPLPSGTGPKGEHSADGRLVRGYTTSSSTGAAGRRLAAPLSDRDGPVRRHTRATTAAAVRSAAAVVKPTVPRATTAVASLPSPAAPTASEVRAP